MRPEVRDTLIQAGEDFDTVKSLIEIGKYYAAVFSVIKLPKSPQGFDHTP